MKKFLLSLLLSLTLVNPVLAAKPVNIGNIYLDNIPTYNGLASFHWTFPKKPFYPTLGIFCEQNETWVYIAELGVSQALNGSATVTINNETSSATPGHIDYTRPADCQAYMWDERSNGQQPIVITNQVFFIINP